MTHVRIVFRHQKGQFRQLEGEGVIGFEDDRFRTETVGKQPRGDVDGHPESILPVQMIDKSGSEACEGPVESRPEQGIDDDFRFRKSGEVRLRVDVHDFQGGLFLKTVKVDFRIMAHLL